MTNEEAIDIVLKMAKDQWIVTASNIEITRQALEIAESMITKNPRLGDIAEIRVGHGP
jgi:hypothetical protein